MTIHERQNALQNLLISLHQLTTRECLKRDILENLLVPNLMLLEITLIQGTILEQEENIEGKNNSFVYRVLSKRFSCVFTCKYR